MPLANLALSGSKCPFLSKLPLSFLKNHGKLIVQKYSQFCPVVSHHANLKTGLSLTDEQYYSEPHNILLAPSKKISYQRNYFSTAPTNQLNVAKAAVDTPKDSKSDSTAFDYSSYFDEKIRQKKLDHSYRVFKKLGRIADQFPRAFEYSMKPSQTNSLAVPDIHSASQQHAKNIIVWCSNDYLGMSRHPLVKRAVIEALEKYGAGSGGTRNIAGNSILHEELESLLAILHQKEKALLFTSCYVANDTTLFTLARMLPGCHLYSDSGNHASMIQGIRNSLVPKHIFKHNDPTDLTLQLKESHGTEIPKIVAFETVHSMSGAICPLKQMCEISHEHGALTFVDEVHAVGLYGKHGAGIGERNNCVHAMDMITGTLGKAFGSIGGYLASNANLIDAVRSYGSGFIFTTSLPPTVLAAALTSVKILMSSEGVALREKHQENVKYLRNALMQNGIPVIHTPSHIIPISIGDPMVATKISDTLLSKFGHYVQAINYPTVPKGSERLRLAPTPFHTQESMDNLIRDLISVWNELGLPFKTPICQFNCEYCMMPLKFEMYASRHEFMPCADVDCPKLAEFISSENLDPKTFDNNTTLSNSHNLSRNRGA